MFVNITFFLIRYLWPDQESIVTVILEGTPTFIPEGTPTFIPEIFYRESSNLSSPKTTPMSSPTWLGIQCFLSFFVILIFCNSWNQLLRKPYSHFIVYVWRKNCYTLMFLSWIHVSFYFEEINTSWIPAFAGMTQRLQE